MKYEELKTELETNYQSFNQWEIENLIKKIKNRFEYIKSCIR